MTEKEQFLNNIIWKKKKVQKVYNHKQLIKIIEVKVTRVKIM